MNTKITEKIFERCPIIYRTRGDKSSTVGRWGFECNDGWGEIVYELSLKLEQIALAELDSGLEINEVTKIQQVKQKFAQLRVYVYTKSPDVNHLIEHYQRIAAETCELCGKPGIKRVIEFYHCVTCPECYESLRSRNS